VSSEVQPQARTAISAYVSNMERYSGCRLGIWCAGQRRTDTSPRLRAKSASVTSPPEVSGRPNCPRMDNHPLDGVWPSCGRWRHLRRFVGFLRTSPKTGPKSSEECGLATGQAHGARCNRWGGGATPPAYTTWGGNVPGPPGPPRRRESLNLPAVAMSAGSAARCTLRPKSARNRGKSASWRPAKVAFS
jgi:hypothetical protein